MAERKDPMFERELERRRENEKKDLEVENLHEERPLEGLSSATTTWTRDQDDGAAPLVHGDDEAMSQKASRDQIPPVRPVDPIPEG